MGGILSVSLTAFIMKKCFTVTSVARSVARYRACTQNGEVRNKMKDTTICVVGRKAQKQPWKRYGGVRKKRKTMNLYEIQMCTGNHHHARKKGKERVLGRVRGSKFSLSRGYDFSARFEIMRMILAETHTIY